MENTDRRLASTISTVILGGALLTALAFNTGCSGPVLIMGTAKGIQAAGDVLTGNSLVAKQPGNIQGAHFHLRELETTEETARANHDGFFTRLLRGSEK